MASGSTLLTFLAQDGQPTSSGAATIDTVNSQLVDSFPAGAVSDITFEGVLPRNYSGGGLTVTLWWMAASATANTPQWEVSFERHQAGTSNLASDNYAAAQVANPTAPGTFGIISATAIPFTNGAQMASIAAGESFRMRVRRNGTAGGDTMTGAAQLLAVEIRET